MAKMSTQPPPPKSAQDHISYLSSKLAAARAELRGYESNLTRIESALLSLAGDVGHLEVTVSAISSALSVIKWLVGLSSASILAALAWAFLTLSQNTITIRRLDAQVDQHLSEARDDETSSRVETLFKQNQKLLERINDLELQKPKADRRWRGRN